MAVASKPGADLSAIQRLIRRARLRIRTQWAIEGATTGAILAAAAALAAVFAIRLEWVTLGTGVFLLIGAASIIVLGAVVSASRRIDDETIARRIDRASDLADRLSTAIAFDRALTLALRAALTGGYQCEGGDTELMKTLPAIVTDAVGTLRPSR